MGRASFVFEAAPKESAAGSESPSGTISPSNCGPAAAVLRIQIWNWVKIFLSTKAVLHITQRYTRSGRREGGRVSHQVALDARRTCSHCIYACVPACVRARLVTSSPSLAFLPLILSFSASCLWGFVSHFIAWSKAHFCDTVHSCGVLGSI
jgi:hypothetical protein